MSIRKLPDGGAKPWEWRIWLPDGRHPKKTFRTQSEAKAHDAKVRADLARGTYIGTSNDKTTVTEKMEQFLASRPVRESTELTYRSLINNYYRPTALGARPYLQVKPSEVQEWVKTISQSVTPGTVHKALTMRAPCTRPPCWTGSSPTIPSCQPRCCPCRRVPRQRSCR